MWHAGRCSPSGGNECLYRLETKRVFLHGDEAAEISDSPLKPSLSLQKSSVHGRLHSIVCDPRGCGLRTGARLEDAGRAGPRRSMPGVVVQGALRLWDVSGRRAGSSSPALLRGPPPPPSASSSLACSRASPSPTVGFLRGYCRGSRAE